MYGNSVTSVSLAILKILPPLVLPGTLSPVPHSTGKHQNDLYGLANSLFQALFATKDAYQYQRCLEGTPPPRILDNKLVQRFYDRILMRAGNPEGGFPDAKRMLAALRALRRRKWPATIGAVAVVVAVIMTVIVVFQWLGPASSRHAVMPGDLGACNDATNAGHAPSGYCATPY